MSQCGLSAVSGAGLSPWFSQRDGERRHVGLLSSHISPPPITSERAAATGSGTEGAG